MSDHPTSKAAEFEGLLIARADAALLDWCHENFDLIATALRLHEMVELDVRDSYRRAQEKAS